ncbi:response regulator transcription factor [Tengunoibacter tsumagoiensis]|uniref:DNA-binding response regulator n=1 Tax=Tengunoibacter tsumagoiensis TaxID=2014871 RepID=A0A402A981_9CHLR|nr:response regulator transcription factor [Tengunoibacter tsumagoiensis]GCE15556.1 DNA-binding response regulator [Tengunoibacter tsumagoiensis]
MSEIIRVVIVDDHPIVREGIRLMLATSDDLALVGDAADGVAALQTIEELQPDVVLLDIRLPGMGGLDVLKFLRKTWPQIAVLILTTYNEDELIVRGFQAGASGYLLKEGSLETLFHAIRAASRGGVVMQPEIMTRVLAHTTSPAGEETPALTHSPIAPLPSPLALTNREQEVLAGVACGERSKEIAKRLGITERTVRAYLTNIYTKLNVDSRASAVALALKYGLLPTQTET